MTVASVEIARPVTDEEVAHFHEHGWVKLEQLVSPETAREMLAAAKAAMGERPVGLTDKLEGLKTGDRIKTTHAGGGKIYDTGWWQDYHFIARDDQAEPFRSFSYSTRMGENVQRLMGRDVGVRYFSDMIACKMPSGQPGSGATGWHQDMCVVPFDRRGGMSVWLAIDDLPPEKGTMRFLSGAHREGPLGAGRRIDLFAVYPYLLEQYELSEPIHLKPGDATVHGLLTPHGAPENTTDDPRWGYITFYVPADTLYTGAPYATFDGTGIGPYQTLDHPQFPIVYP